MEKRIGNMAGGSKKRPTKNRKPVAREEKSLRYFGDPGSMAVKANCITYYGGKSLGELLQEKLRDAPPHPLSSAFRPRRWY